MASKKVVLSAVEKNKLLKVLGEAKKVDPELIQLILMIVQLVLEFIQKRRSP